MRYYDQIVEAYGKLKEASGERPYAALINKKNYDRVKRMEHFRGRDGDIVKDQVGLYGLRIEVNNWVQDDIVIVVNKETYEEIQRYKKENDTAAIIFQSFLRFDGKMVITGTEKA